MQNDITLSPVQSFFRNKWVRRFLLIDLLLILILVIVFIWQSTRVSTVNFDVTPLDSTITINGNRYENGQYSITPGSYNVTISHDNMTTKTFTIDVAPQDVASITTFLVGEDNSFTYYKRRDNYMSYQKLAEIASSQRNVTTDHDTSAENFIKEFQEDYNTYLAKLPFDYHESTGYGQTLEILKNITFRAKYDCESTLCIQALIVGTEDKDFINSLLQEKGFKVEDFEIEYKFY